MSEQTANLCTTDAAESLRAVVAERDREIERLKEGQSILIFARDEQKRLANEYRDLWSRAALKAQPSGVVRWPEADEIMQMAFEEGQPSEDASGYYFELEEFDLFIQRLMEEVARLNSSPVSAGEYGVAYQGAREDMAIWKRRALEAETKVREQDQIIENLGNALNDENGPTFMGEPVIRAGGVDERAAQCDHQWTDDGLHLLVCTSCGAQEDHDPHWRDMATAPRDGTMVRLLVEFTEHETEDADQAPTIGVNNFDNDGEDRWQFAGWCWSHDHFVEGKGEPVGWLPMIEARALSAPSHGELSVLREYRTAIRNFNDSHGVETDTLDEAVEIERKAEARLEAAEKACHDFYAGRKQEPSHGEQVRHMVPAGWKLVPVEPTPEMLAAGDKYIGTPATYKAMPSACPSPAITKDFSQFLSAVMDAAGLIRHGRQSKELSEYLGMKCMEYRGVAPSPGSQEQG